MSELLYDIAVIGGGASGMIAALSAVKSAPHLRVAVLERLSRVGKKLMATGNGRCNITNMNASEKNYHGSVSFMRPAMAKYPPKKVLSFFETLGVHCREEDEGRVYPMSDQASSVLDTLRLSMEESGVEEICDFEVVSLTRAKNGYRLTAKDSRQLIAKRVICAAGGLASPSLGGSSTGYKLLESCGHELTPRFPALVQLKTNPEYTRPLKGIKYSGAIDLFVDGQLRRTETGEILFTEYGLSGIAVMQISRIAAQALSLKRPPTVEARLHLLPMSYDAVFELLRSRRRMLSKRALENFLTGLVNKRLGQMIIKWTTGLNLSEPSGILTDSQLSDLTIALTEWMIQITGTQGFDQAQVTAGGVKTEDVNPHTMESLLADGLYITGEVLDIDGDCGGYNLQWAWASGLTAGEACAHSLTSQPEKLSSASEKSFSRPAASASRGTGEHPGSGSHAPHISHRREHSSPQEKPCRAKPDDSFRSRPARKNPDSSESSRRPDGFQKRNSGNSGPHKPSLPSKGMKKPHD